MDSSQPAKKAKLETPRAEAPFRGFVDLQVCMQIYAWFGCCEREVYLTEISFVLTFTNNHLLLLRRSMGGVVSISPGLDWLKKTLQKRLTMYVCTRLSPCIHHYICSLHITSSLAPSLLFTLPIARSHVHIVCYLHYPSLVYTCTALCTIYVRHIRYY